MDNAEIKTLSSLLKKAIDTKHWEQVKCVYKELKRTEVKMKFDTERMWDIYIKNTWMDEFN